MTLWVKSDRLEMVVQCPLVTRKHRKSGHARGVRDCTAVGLYHVSFSVRYRGDSGYQAELAKMSKMTHHDISSG
jgi:hypothetical protein